MQKFIGTGVALTTPFKKDLSVDFLALAKLVEFNISNGVNYLVINGTTGESATISKEERQKIIEVVVERLDIKKIIFDQVDEFRKNQTDTILANPDPAE